MGRGKVENLSSVRVLIFRLKVWYITVVIRGCRVLGQCCGCFKCMRERRHTSNMGIRKLTSHIPSNVVSAMETEEVVEFVHNLSPSKFNTI